MSFETVTGTGRRLTFGDAPEANHHSPVELVTATIAACSAMDVVSILAKKRERPEAYTITVEAVQRDEYPQVLTRIDIVHELLGDVSEAALRRAVELSALKYCPVNAMLSAGDTQVHHRYRVREAGGGVRAEGEVSVTGPYRRPAPIER